MMNRIEFIKKAFVDLRTEEGDSGQRVRRRIDNSAPVSIHAACSFPHRKAIIEIGPVRTNWLPLDFKKPDLKGITFSLISNHQRAGEDLTLIMELQKYDYITIFATFAARICIELDQLTEPDKAIRAVLHIINKWKSFFSGNVDWLSENQQTGLYGELHWLELLFEKDFPIDTIVSAWTGSSRTSQDYEFDKIAIEIKSTTAIDTSIVKISNIRQLDDSALDVLFLVRTSFDVRRGNENTLPELITKIRTKIHDSAPTVSIQFEEKLINAGYYENHSDHYAQRCYFKRTTDSYRITNGFPRLLESKIPNGITKVSFELSLDYCKEFLVAEEVVLNAIRNCCDRKS